VSVATPSASTGKRDFTALYTAPDPRAYFSYFAGLEYGVVGAGARLFRRLLDEVGRDGAVADVCCSYGQDAALLNHHVDDRELFAHWGGPDVADLDRAELLRRDRAWFAERRRDDAVAVLGLDVSAPAVEYGLAAGLLDGGRAGDPESDPAVDLSVFAPVDGVVVTGGIGYVGERTFARLLDHVEEPPWVCGLVLRWVDLGPVARMLSARGYTVQVGEDHPVVQRRVVDDDERAAMLAGLAALDRSPGRLEQSGYHAAIPFLATPAGLRAPALGRLARGLDAG
jgi:hypothetical protein